MAHHREMVVGTKEARTPRSASRRRLVQGVLAAAGLHLAATAALWLASPSWVPLPTEGEEPPTLTVELAVVPEALLPAGAPDPTAVAPPAAPSPLRSPGLRRPVARRTGVDVRSAATATAVPDQPPSSAPPAALPRAPAHDWLGMRAPSSAGGPLAALPSAPETPGGPGDGQLFAPAPNVLHHRVGGDLGSVRPGPSGLKARIATDGAIRFEDPPPINDLRVRFAPLGFNVSGRFDLGDHLARAAGQDPYAYEKRKLREQTFEDRLCLAEKAALDRKREALMRLEEHLERLLALPGRGPAARRAALLEVWDECGTGDAALDRAARATVLAFARRAFPADGPQAFTSDELHAFNRSRRGQAVFDPYGTWATRTRADGGATER